MLSREGHRVREILAGHPELELAVLFGSQARGTAGPASDLDLAVSAGRPLNTDERMSLIAELASVTGRSIDLVDLARVGEPLLGQIVTGGVQLAGEREAFGRLMSRHLFEQADFLPLRERILAERRRAWIGD
ncbi:MAG: nucleotidyltransferase domain-containing protein [Spiribacter salinus]|uniref:Nucleotidyltransferase domain-containing protein n=1 Tax=Spiribacter salinus TaxID=1335746 RepID=A0A540VR23_9GAMM|nr:MAG: nucleotidyltransferase domain-containing protein [Spiribacter salinus]